MSWVKFPDGGGKGGLFVRIVVIDRDGQGWQKCTGGYTSAPDDETFLGWDVDPDPEGSRPGEWQYLAVVNVGSLPRSPQFVCTYKDLKEKGRALHDTLTELYGRDGDVHIQTWMGE